MEILCIASPSKSDITLKSCCFLDVEMLFVETKYDSSFSNVNKKLKSLFFNSTISFAILRNCQAGKLLVSQERNALLSNGIFILKTSSLITSEESFTKRISITVISQTIFSNKCKKVHTNTETF